MLVFSDVYLFSFFLNATHAAAAAKNPETTTELSPRSEVAGDDDTAETLADVDAAVDEAVVAADVLLSDAVI